ncbi:MAG TPA: ATP-binding protein [Verrucomicrobiae bacterium]|jgi:signal transduction histidine kinase/CheY-like chemotaxis protein
MKRQAGKQFYKLVVVAWLTFSVGSVALALVSWYQLSAQMVAGRRMAATRDELHDVVKSLFDVETGERGYVITGNKDFLAPFVRAETNLPAQFNLLENFVHDDPRLSQSVAELRVETEGCLGWQREVINTRNLSFNQAVAVFSTGKFKNPMDKVRLRVEELDRICLDKQLSIREEIQNRVIRANLTTLVAGIFGIGAGLLALWLSYVAVRHQQRERELTKAKLQAEHSNEEKSIFLANMSHEIRTPMNAILGFSELLQGDLREPKHRQYLKSIRTSADSLLQLINDILDMSKIEAGMMELRPEPTDPREICDFIRTLFSEPAAKKSVRLECHVAADLPHTVLMDRIRLRQILVNLVGNAVKFTDKGGVDVRVLWEKEQTSSRITLIIEVQDTGTGIPKDKLDAIFKPFVQAGTHGEKEKQGTGLGLSIVKRLTEIMGGTVTVASVPGEGSAFHLRFPNVSVSARLPAPEKLSEAGDVNFNELCPATVLVVDDNETNCQLIAGMFDGSHHRLVFGASGEEAVKSALETRPDVILLDVRMPGMDGRAALDKIRMLPGLELTPIIAVTASSLLDEENSLRERFSGFLRKPFSTRELFDEISGFLPRQAKSETSGAGALEQAGMTGTAPATVPKELVTRLRQLLIEPWPSIRDSVAVNESRTFAQGLEGLGERWQCQPLVAYAQKLLQDADNYAVTDLEKHLGEFAALVEQLALNTRK